MAVEKYFWIDPYMKEIEARVETVDNNVVTLDRTIAYAFSGGQQSDSGTIGGYDIEEARKDDHEIFYSLESGHALKPNDLVTVKIDWEKRYRLMRLHMAAELVLETVYQDYGHPEKIGANINEEKARVDFYWEGNITSLLPELTGKVTAMIESDLDIVSEFSDEENEVRHWRIEGFAQVPCGGTHLKKTGEIGSIKLKRRNVGSGKERIEIYLQP